MSRFRSAKEIKGAMQGLEDGTIDIVVGTHKLLSESVKFKRLGLLIIDEEHRFGVRHKEAIKAMRADIDVLTLSATPPPLPTGEGPRLGGPHKGPTRARRPATAVLPFPPPPPPRARGWGARVNTSMS